MQCPHTFLEPHSLPLFDSYDATEQTACPVCHGRIRICAECREPNRLAARYCTRCGQALQEREETNEKLLPPGGLKEAIGKAARYSLDECLNLQEDDRIVCWLAAEEGAFVITGNRAFEDSPHKAFLIPGFRFENKRAIPLNERADLPNYKDWIEEPLVSKEGVFVCTRDSLHFFASHGSQSIDRHQVWRPRPGEGIEAIGASSNGSVRLLLRTQDRRLLIAEGNTQSGQWTTTWELSGIRQDSRGYLWVRDGLEEDRLRLFTGTELLECDEHAHARISIDVVENATFPGSLVERIRFACFSPFVIRPDGVQAKCVAPFWRPASGNAQVAVIPIASSSAPTLIDEKTLHWVLPDAYGQGLMIASESGVKRYVGRGEPSWSATGARVQHKPILRKTWLAMQAEQRGLALQHSESCGAILFASISRHQDQLNIGDTTTVKLPASGETVAGAPPLYWNHSIYIMLQNINDESTTVYTARITE